MCGIAGIIRTDGGPVDVARLQEMTTRLRHRGPDDEGYLLGTFPSGEAVPACGAQTVAPLRAQLPAVEVGARPASLIFGHRRLAIIDCTPAGHQPMADREGLLWLVYNGEIYNYIELREDLARQGHLFRTRSDSEVLLAAYAEWGPACLDRFNGMWSFCIWDRRRGELFCARDRFGVKPFYYSYDGATFAFASEIKALLAGRALAPTINEDSAYDYLQLDLLDHTDSTMIAGVQQLPPGHCLRLGGGGQLTVRRYYTLSHTSVERDCDVHSIAALGATYRDLLSEAVRLRLRTDVPLGSCLSGGLDSSAIVCTMRRLLPTSGAQQQTFTAAYDDPASDERQFAEQVVAATGATAHYVFPRGEELWDELVALSWYQDEPFSSTSIYAQWCVMRAARRAGVTVMLDGQGGDELFAGYTIYYPIWPRELLRRGRLARFREECVSSAPMLERTPVRLAAKAAAVLYEPLTKRLRRRRRGLELLNEEFARRHVAHDTRWEEARPRADLQTRLWADQGQFRLPRLLHYEDRNSMAFSIEARIPFVDVHLAEWAFQQPPEVKLHHGWTKYVARQGIVGVCPDPIVWRTDKMGFATPETQWMQAGAEMLRALSEPKQFRAGAFIDPHKLRAQLFPGDRLTPRWRRPLWRAACFELWMRVFALS